MKTLFLLRHAKAAEDGPDGTDHARPLAKRGIKAAKAMAAHLASNKFSVDKVFCSTSRRTRETYAYIAPVLPGAPVAYRDRLYLVDTGDLMEFIQSFPDTAAAVMVIGHNPAFHFIALALARSAGPGHSAALAALKEKFPTGALCCLQFDVPHWRKITAGGGILTGFVRPSELADD